MNIATVLFTYNRSFHTNEVIKALSKNTVLPPKLYIFQDGLKQEEHRIEWEKVNDLIRAVEFCPTELHISDKNIGVAETIVSGVNYVLERHDAVIVLEDDCVPAPGFIAFMEQCFEKYKEDERVYSVSGYAWPIDLVKGQYDIYGCGRTCSWGWGTWRDRWRGFSFDNNILKRLKKDEEKSKTMATWGDDCERMLLANVVGRIDAWDIYWTLHVFENNGICVNPYESLIQNIGLDGSGVHCGVYERFCVKLSDSINTDFNLPDHLDMLQTTKMAYAELFGNYTAVNREDTIKENVIVYGLGKFFRQHEKEINEKYYIKAFIDRRAKGWYAGKKVITLGEVLRYDYDRVIIMVQNIRDCIQIAKELIGVGVDEKQITLGHSAYGRYCEGIDKISVLSDGGLLLTFGNSSIKVESEEEFDHVCEVFVNQLYNYTINNRKKDIVFDIGRGLGDAALYFSNLNNVEKVYGYELTGEGGIQNLVEEISTVIQKCFNHNVILKLAYGAQAYDILNALSQKGVLNSAMVIMIVADNNEERDRIINLLKGSEFSWKLSGIDRDRKFIYAYKC